MPDFSSVDITTLLVFICTPKGKILVIKEFSEQYCYLIHTFDELVLLVHIGQVIFSFKCTIAHAVNLLQRLFLDYEVHNAATVKHKSSFSQSQHGYFW